MMAAISMGVVTRGGRRKRKNHLSKHGRGHWSR